MQKKGRFYSGERGRRIKIITACIALLILVAIAAIPPALPLDSGSGAGSVITEESFFSGKWIPKNATPKQGGLGEAIVGTGSYIYAIRSSSTGNSSYFWKYNPLNDTWSTIKRWDDSSNSDLDLPRPKSGTALAWDNNTYIYIMFGGAKNDSNRKYFYRYNITDNSWKPLNDTPHSQGAGNAITWANGSIYAMMGSRWPKHNGTRFARYNCSNNNNLWENLTLNPNWNNVTDDGASLVWTGGKYLYALQGEWEENVSHCDFARYNIDNKSWERMKDIPENESPGSGGYGVGDGASLLWVGGWIPEYSNYIFALGGGGAYDPEHPGKEPPGYNFYCYNIPKNNWTRLESVPYPVGTWVGNRLGFARGYIYYWQGAPKTEEYDHICSGKAFYMFEFLSAIFDTGLPKNPYPSIFGTHNGTITPNKTITVSKLYTYPCVGTGGHTKYARIWNKTWEGTEARWRGYQGDWKNISFNESFVLYAGETYNYTIRTGSYSLIHHTPALQTANGWINCTEFVDVNGKRYKYGIPAIRLTHDEETLRIGAFNIQVFGKSKASKPEVMDVLGKIIRTYDVIAIQEIRDKSQTALPALVNTVNSDNSEYDYVVSERLGRTTSKEQYAYIYNTQTVELTDTPYTYPEPAGTDPFHREPYIASFKGGNFDFTLVGIHTKPDPKGTRTYSEISHLTDVVDSILARNPNEKDIIVLGDFNADGDYFDEDTNTNPFKAPKFRWVITNDMDTMVMTDWTYDRMVMMNATLDHEYVSGSAAVFYFDTEYGIIDENLVCNVSDHYPIYAKFRTDLADDD